MTLEEMRAVDPRTVDRNTLMQRSSVKINPGADKEERIRDFILEKSGCIADICML